MPSALALLAQRAIIQIWQEAHGYVPVKGWEILWKSQEGHKFIPRWLLSTFYGWIFIACSYNVHISEHNGMCNKGNYGIIEITEMGAMDSRYIALFSPGIHEERPNNWPVRAKCKMENCWIHSALAFTVMGIVSLCAGPRCNTSSPYSVLGQKTSKHKSIHWLNEAALRTLPRF